MSRERAEEAAPEANTTTSQSASPSCRVRATRALAEAVLLEAEGAADECVSDSGS